MKRSYSIILAIFFVEFFATVSTFGQGWQWQNAVPGGYQRLEQKYRQANEQSTPNDSNVTVLGRWAWGPCYAVAAKKDLVLIGNGSTLQILDAANPASPSIIGELITPEIIYDLVISGNFAYVLSPFQVVDISNSISPQIVFSESIGTNSTRLSLNGDYVYAGDFSGVIHIIDKREPTQPQEVGSLLASGRLVTSIAVAEPYLYTTTTDGLSIDIFDISNKQAGILVGRLITGGIGSALVVQNQYLYEGDSTQPLFKIFDHYCPVVF